MSENLAQGVGQNMNAWSSMRVNIAYQEARTVLNTQQTRKKHIDNRALRTAKLATVVATGAVPLVKALNVHIRPWMGVSIGALLLISLGFSLATYTTNSIRLGPNEAEINQLILNRFPTEIPVNEDLETEPWEHGLGVIMGEWVSYNQRVIAKARLRLIVAQTTLFFSLAFPTARIIFTL